MSDSFPHRDRNADLGNQIPSSTLYSIILQEVTGKYGECLNLKNYYNKRHIAMSPLQNPLPSLKHTNSSFWSFSEVVLKVFFLQCHRLRCYSWPKALNWFKTLMFHCHFALWKSHKSHSATSDEKCEGGHINAFIYLCFCWMQCSSILHHIFITCHNAMSSTINWKSAKNDGVSASKLSINILRQLIVMAFIILVKQ